MSAHKQSLNEQLKSEYDRWSYYYIHGGNDPTWSDGANMNLIRNHIVNIKRQMEEAGELTDTYYRELPQEVDIGYMAREDEIRKNAMRSLEIYKSHPDYLYLCTIIELLGKRQINDTCIQNVIGYARGLEMYIKEECLVGMRRHEHPENYIQSFVDCRKRVEKIICEEHKDIFFEDNKGQLTMATWLTV